MSSHTDFDAELELELELELDLAGADAFISWASLSLALACSSLVSVMGDTTNVVRLLHSSKASFPMVFSPSGSGRCSPRRRPARW